MFNKAARAVSNAVGSPVAFMVAAGIVIVWAAIGPFVGFTEGWQLVINTATTITTFLMVFLLQNTQNHDTRALHTKLDELIHSLPGPRDEIAGIEREDEDDQPYHRS